MNKKYNTLFDVINNISGSAITLDMLNFNLIIPNNIETLFDIKPEIDVNIIKSITNCSNKSQYFNKLKKSYHPVDDIYLDNIRYYLKNYNEEKIDYYARLINPILLAKL